MTVSAVSFGVAGCNGGESSSSASSVPAALSHATTQMSVTVTRRGTRTTASGFDSHHVLSVAREAASVEVDAYNGTLPLPTMSAAFAAPNGVQPVTTACANFPTGQNTLQVAAQVPIGMATVVISAYSGPCSGNAGPGSTGTGSILNQASGTGTATGTGGSIGNTFFASPNGVYLGLIATPSPSASPTVSPTASPTAVPTVSPTVSPTVAPTVSPTVAPTPTSGTYTGNVQ